MGNLGGGGGGLSHSGKDPGHFLIAGGGGILTMEIINKIKRGKSRKDRIRNCYS
jgi:hypothetical protein